MPDGSDSGEIKRGRKFDQVLSGAREIFLKDGFERASVDDIARCAGVSKATLYSYFPDKRLLFVEVAKAECRRQAQAGQDRIDTAQPARQVLFDVAWQTVEAVTSEFGHRIFRLCVAEGGRFPAIGRAFYESGPLILRERLVEFFDTAIARGELRIEDKALAADQFVELCKADLYPRMMFNMERDFSPQEKQRVADAAVEMFLARYGARGEA